MPISSTEILSEFPALSLMLLMAVLSNGSWCATSNTLGLMAPGPLPNVSGGPASDLDGLLAPRPRGWVGADGAASVLLADGRVLWVFADSVVGVREGRKRNGVMIRNTIALQPAGSRNPEDVSFWWRLPGGIPDAMFPPANQEDRHWYWPGCAVEVNGTVYLFMMKLMHRQGPGDYGVFAFRSVGCTLIRIPNPGDPVDEWRTSQVDMYRGDEHMNINVASMVEGDFVYLLGYSDGPKNRNRDRAAILARLPVSALDASDPGGSLEFLSDDDQWRSPPDRLKPLFRPGPAESSLHFDPVRRRYMAFTQQPFGTDLLLVSAEKLTGPWSDPQTVYEIPDVADRRGVFAYATRAHPELSADPNELIVTYVVNADSMWDMLADTGIYYPRFVRLILGEPETGNTKESKGPHDVRPETR